MRSGPVLFDQFERLWGRLPAGLSLSIPHQQLCEGAPSSPSRPVEILIAELGAADLVGASDQ